MLLRANNLLPNSRLKPARVGVRADDIGAKRLEEACIPRDGDLRRGVQNHSHKQANQEIETTGRLLAMPFTLLRGFKVCAPLARRIA